MNRFRIRSHLGRLATVRAGVILLITFACALAFSEVSSDRSRKRLDDLFRWRVSDTLQLDAKQEAAFGNVLDRVHDKRRQAGDEMSRIVGELSKTEIMKSGNKKQIESLISQYEKQMKVYGDTQTEELNELRKVFGTEKLGRYLIFKNELGRKLKSALSSVSPEATTPASASAADLEKKVDAQSNSTATPPKEKLPEPSIIENE